MVTSYVEGSGALLVDSASTVAFVPGDRQAVDSDVVFEWDFDNDGDFDDPLEDITSYVFGAQARVGRDRPSTVNGVSQPGQLRLRLDNRDGRFSHFRADSPLNQAPYALTTGRKIRVRRSGACTVLDLPGTAGAYASTPDAAAFDITGDLSLWGDVDLDDWTPGSVATVVGKWAATGNQRSYKLQVDTTGTPRLLWSTAGTAVSSSTVAASAPLPELTGRWMVAASIDVDNGAAGKTIRFYRRRRRTETWVLHGTAQTSAGTTSIFAGTAPVEVGSSDGGTIELLAGTVYAAEIRSGLMGVTGTGGTLVAHVPFTSQAQGAGSFTDDQGRTWTVSGAAALVAGNEFVEPDPRLLFRDRFQRRDDDFIGYGDFAATGLSRIYDEPRANDFTISSKRAAPALASVGNQVMAIVDVGRVDAFAQIRLVSMGLDTGGATSSYGGLVYRYQDGNNYSMLRMIDGSTSGFDRMELVDVVAGVESVIQSSNLAIEPNMTLGVWLRGDVVQAYLDGIVVMTDTAIQQDETGFGFVGLWGAGNAAPTFDSFFVWESLPSYATAGPAPATSGVLGTFEVRQVSPASASRAPSVVEVEATGVLDRLGQTDITPPRYRTAQAPGFVVGKALADALAIHPPAGGNAIDRGDVATGPVVTDESTARLLEVVRPFERHERGLLWERPEGGLAFDGSAARSSLPLLATLSDAPGAQFGFETIELLDWTEEIVNRVEPGVAAAMPEFVGSEHTGATAAGVNNNVAIAIPTTVQDGDLIIFIVTSAVADTVETWNEPPIWWVAERGKLGTLVRQRVFTHISDGTDGGTLVVLQNDVTPVGGSWVAYRIRVLAGTWFGTHEGIAMGAHGGPTDPPKLELPWGSQPTLVIATRGAMRGTGITVSGPRMPVGYTQIQSTFENGISGNLDDAAQQVAYRTTVDPVVDATPFGGTFSGGLEVESAVIAIRGYAGQSPERDGIRRLQVDDRQSQVDHNLIQPLTDPSTLYPTEEAAEEAADGILADHSEPRPYLRVTFTATKNAGYRDLASRLRLTEKVAIVADGETGPGVRGTGLGVRGEYHIESIAHDWSDAGKRWEVTWELSPA